MTGTAISNRGLSIYRRVFLVSGGTLLALPLVAMQFTTEVNWKIGDFLVFAAMLAVLGAGIELILRRLVSNTWRVTGIVFALGCFVFVWGALATS